MTNEKNKAEVKIIRTILYNLMVFLVIIFWFFYSTYDNRFGLILICIFIAVIIIFSFIFNIRITKKISIQFFHFALMLIPISFIIEIIFSYEALNPPIFISYYSLIGINLNHNFFIFLIYFGLTIVKVLPIKIFYDKIVKILKNEQIDEFFEYFMENLNGKKSILLILLLPLSAFIEEFVFRSLLLTLLVKFLNWNIILVILLISCIFGFSHYSSSKNWVHFLSTFISSIIYFLALVQLGLLYPWILHLTTNSLAFLFFYQNNKKKQNIIFRRISMI